MPWYKSRPQRAAPDTDEQLGAAEDESVGGYFRRTPEVQVEVLALAGLVGIGHRLKGLFGGSSTCELRPYVEVSCGTSTARTAAVDAVAGDVAAFGEAVRLPLLDGIKSTSPRRLELVFRVLHRRGDGKSFSRDPLLGEAIVVLGEESLGLPNIRTVWLTRFQRCGSWADETDCAAHGGLVTMRVGVLAPHSAYRVLGSCRRRKLAHVAKALAQVLVQPEGAELLLASRPPSLAVVFDNEKEEALLLRLQTWIVQLDSCVERLDGQEDDQAVVWHLARVVRAAQELVASLCSSVPNRRHEEVHDLTANWILAIFKHCAESQGMQLSLDETQVGRILFAGRAGGGAAHECLSNLGVVLPSGTGDHLEVSILARLLQAERKAEVEMFTGEPIISNGRVTKGLAAVTHPGCGADDVYVYLYSRSAICRWVAEHGSDPVTRVSLDLSDVLPLHLEPCLVLVSSIKRRAFAATAMAISCLPWLSCLPPPQSQPLSRPRAWCV